jgi:YidC/Oxa1 family membrane protein insertase
MILASFITNAIAPFAKIFGWLLAAFYSVTGNYGLAIVFLTLVTMIVVFPLTRKGTRSMMKMQLLQPEMMKLRNKYKIKPGMTSEEKQEIRLKQQEETMALYKDNGVSMTGGCLPMFLQFPFFIVLYNTIRGMTRTVTVGKGKAAHVVGQPLYIPAKTRLYQNLIHSGGKMQAFGLNLADSVRSHQHALIDVAPYVIVILVAVALQYVSIWQITNRNPTSGANQQMQQIQKFMPLIFVFIYIEFPAGVGLYFIVSSMFRIGQQEWMYKRDPQIIDAVHKLREQKAKAPPVPAGQKMSFRERLREASGTASLEPGPAAKGNPTRTGKPGTRPGQKPGARPVGARPNTRTGTAARNGRPSPSKTGGSGGSGGAGPRRPRPAGSAAGPNNPARPRPSSGTQPRKPGSRPPGTKPANPNSDRNGSGRPAGSNGHSNAGQPPRVRPAEESGGNGSADRAGDSRPADPSSPRRLRRPR